MVSWCRGPRLWWPFTFVSEADQTPRHETTDHPATLVQRSTERSLSGWEQHTKRFPADGRLQGLWGVGDVPSRRRSRRYGRHRCGRTSEPARRMLRRVRGCWRTCCSSGRSGRSGRTTPAGPCRSALRADAVAGRCCGTIPGVIGATAPKRLGVHVGARHAERVEAGPDRSQELGRPAQVELAVQSAPRTRRSPSALRCPISS